MSRRPQFKANPMQAQMEAKKKDEEEKAAKAAQKAVIAARAAAFGAIATAKPDGDASSVVSTASGEDTPTAGGPKKLDYQLRTLAKAGNMKRGGAAAVLRGGRGGRGGRIRMADADPEITAEERRRAEEEAEAEKLAKVQAQVRAAMQKSLGGSALPSPILVDSVTSDFTASTAVADSLSREGSEDDEPSDDDNDNTVPAAPVLSAPPVVRPAVPAKPSPVASIPVAPPRPVQTTPAVAPKEEPQPPLSSAPPPRVIPVPPPQPKPPIVIKTVPPPARPPPPRGPSAVVPSSSTIEAPTLPAATTAVVPPPPIMTPVSSQPPSIPRPTPPPPRHKPSGSECDTIGSASSSSTRATEPSLCPCGSCTAPSSNPVPYSTLRSLVRNGDPAVRRCRAVESRLAPHEFAVVFELTMDNFRRLPQWQQTQLRKKTKLFVPPV